MKKLLFALTAVATLSMLVLSAGIADPYTYNQVGLYLTDDGLGPNVTYDVGFPVDVFLVLTNPTDGYNNNEPYLFIRGFDCQLNFNPIGNLDKLGETFPGNYLNIGDNSDITQGFLEYIVGFAEPIPVTDESVVLVMITFMHTAPGVIEVTLGPTSVPAIPGRMAYVTPPLSLEIMYPISGSYDAPLFFFDGDEVAVVNVSFGAVKALYR